MHLRNGGLDIFYIDESHDAKLYVVSAIRVPFLRNVGGNWTLVWHTHFQKAKDWRKRLKATLEIPTTKELHGNVLASGRGNYFKGKHNFSKPKAGAIYRQILSQIDFLPDAAIMSTSASRGKYLYGNERLEAALYALFQRIRRCCSANDCNGMIFFDQGHPEYRKLYRRACVNLPTGSRFGGWGLGLSRNLPLDMFVKDGNEKNSKHCFFTQTADLIAYSAFIKLKGEKNLLSQNQAAYQHGNIYDSLPASLLNKKVSLFGPQDAIVRP